jgi:hypothetical protein
MDRGSGQPRKQPEEDTYPDGRAPQPPTGGAPGAAGSLLRRHRRRARLEDQRWLAASLQVLVPTLRDVHTEVRFGRPVSPSVNCGRDTARTSEEVLREARRMIRETGLDHENV